MRILIVEDDEALAGLISRFLSRISSEEPTVAHTMTEAMKVIDGVSPLDLLTLDLSLPDSTRDETLAKIKDIKASRPDCLLIVVTGTMRPDQEAEAISYGADGFMHKLASCQSSDTFLDTLKDIGRSIARNPIRYQKNLALLEALTEKICEHVACSTDQPQPQN